MVQGSGMTSDMQQKKETKASIENEADKWPKMILAPAWLELLTLIQPLHKFLSMYRIMIS